MNKKVMQRVLAIIGLLFFLLASGCTKGNNIIGNDNSGMPAMSNFADDIKDITLPTELTWDRKDSMVIKTESFRGGIFSYKGKAEIMSLKDYMVASMKDNKWRLVGETASKNIMLAFVKPNKTCMIVIAEGMFSKTELKLYVAIDKTGGGSGGSGGGSFSSQNSQFDNSFGQ